MINKAEATELESIGHDLRNVLTALGSGCMLIESKLGGDEHKTERALLTEMRAAIQDGSSHIDRLRQFKSNARPASDGSPHEVGQ